MLPNRTTILETIFWSIFGIDLLSNFGIEFTTDFGIDSGVDSLIDFEIDCVITLALAAALCQNELSNKSDNCLIAWLVDGRAQPKRQKARIDT